MYTNYYCEDNGTTAFRIGRENWADLLQDVLHVLGGSGASDGTIDVEHLFAESKMTRCIYMIYWISCVPDQKTL